jgi:putative flippase GtrA
MQTIEQRPDQQGGLAAAAQRLRLPVALLKFVLVGLAAFAVTQAGLFVFYDLGVPLMPAKDTRTDFWLFTHPDVRLLIASALAVEIAIVLKFWLHENWTFRKRARNSWFVTRFLQFNAGSFLSSVIIVVTVNVLTVVFGISPYLSNIVGTVLGFAANWLLSTLIIWPSQGKFRTPTETPTL